jgi:membrane protease YdiL (CAAX protease family)
MYKAMPWAMLILLPPAIQFGDVRTVQLVLLFLAEWVLPRIVPDNQPFLVGKCDYVLLYLYIALLIAPIRRSLDWMRVGQWSRSMLIFAAVVIPLSAGGLIGWVHFTRPSLAEHAQKLPQLSHGMFAVYMGGFAIINALQEEIVWRGVVMGALDSAIGAGIFSVIIQAAIFGMAHFRGGFPSGWSGAALAGSFGLAMGLLRRYTRGLLLPWIVHSAADFVVISLIVHYAS